MHAMKTLTYGVGAAALASAIGFIYAQATSDGPPLVPRFGYTTRQAAVQSPMAASPQMDSSSISIEDTRAPRPDNTDSHPPTR